MKLKLHRYTYKLKEVFRISRDAYTTRRSLVVELSLGGLSGYGEASEHAFYKVSLEDMISRAESIRTQIEAYDFKNPKLFWEYLQSLIGDIPFLQCAIDNAAHDLYGKLLELPSYQIWGLPKVPLIKTSFTIGIDTIAKMISKLKNEQFDIYKIKLGTEHDLEIMTALRRESNAIFRVDANCAWTVDQTLENAREMKKIGVEFIEQPLPADDWDGMEIVKAHAVLPIIADESCRIESDVEKCAAYFDGINIKLMKSGGLTPALRMIRNARHLGLKVMCGCMIEGSVGIAAIGQILPLLDYVDMDGALLIDNDPALGVHIHSDGTVTLPDGNGLGVELRK